MLYALTTRDVNLQVQYADQSREASARVDGTLQELLTDGTVKPVVAGAFPFEEAGAAHSMLVERRNLGKVVLTP